MPDTSGAVRLRESTISLPIRSHSTPSRRRRGGMLASERVELERRFDADDPDLHKPSSLSQVDTIFCPEAVLILGADEKASPRDAGICSKACRIRRGATAHAFGHCKKLLAKAIGRSGLIPITHSVGALVREIKKKKKKLDQTCSPSASRITCRSGCLHTNGFKVSRLSRSKPIDQ